MYVYGESCDLALKIQMTSVVFVYDYVNISQSM